MELKRCNRCQQTKPLEAFPWRSADHVARINTCKPCKAELKAERRKLLQQHKPTKARAKLCVDDVQLIRQLSDLPASVVAEKFEVSRQAVQDIRRGWTWKHV